MYLNNSIRIFKADYSLVTKRCSIFSNRGPRSAYCAIKTEIIIVVPIKPTKVVHIVHYSHDKCGKIHDEDTVSLSFSKRKETKIAKLKKSRQKMVDLEELLIEVTFYPY